MRLTIQTLHSNDNFRINFVDHMFVGRCNDKCCMQKKCAYQKVRENLLLSIVLIGLCIHTPCLWTECIAQQLDYNSQPLYTHRQLIDLYFCYLCKGMISGTSNIHFVAFLCDWNYLEIWSETSIEMKNAKTRLRKWM